VRRTRSLRVVLVAAAVSLPVVSLGAATTAAASPAPLTIAYITDVTGQAAAENGIDEEFGRGASPLNRFNGDPKNKPNPCLRKIGPGPYYAVAVWPADLASSAGLRTDCCGRVLRADGAPLQGLYAVGPDAASIFKGTYPGPGTMIGPAMVFAWRAAMDAAGALDNHPVSTD